jgi:Tol biopolymer transport system component
MSGINFWFPGNGEYEGCKVSNPVISPDGRWIAFQSARGYEEAGVGHGIFYIS